MNGCSPSVPRQPFPGTSRCIAVMAAGHVLAGQRRVWDSNPRGRVNALAVFKTAAIGH
jgi:hypothetical protein